MTETPDLRRLYHDIDSKCAGLKGASKLLRGCPPQERKEILTLMKESAAALLKCLSKLERAVISG